MNDIASKEAQEAYVNSLYRMTQEQLIAEVMRVQGAAAELVKTEFERGYRLGHLDGWQSSYEGFNSELGCSKDEYEDIVDDDFGQR